MPYDGHAHALGALSQALVARGPRKLQWVIPLYNPVGEPDPDLVMVVGLEPRTDGSVDLNMIGVPLSELVAEARRQFPATGGFFIFDVDETLLSRKLEGELKEETRARRDPRNPDILRPGAKDMLDALARAGHTLAVNSNSEPGRLATVLAACGIGCVVVVACPIWLHARAYVVD